jgi:alkylation response protein AidB-like acyl-CoA dehydrogenase
MEGKGALRRAASERGGERHASFGGRAYFATEEMERYYREAPLALYAGGTVEIQKNVIARLTGLATA